MTIDPYPYLTLYLKQRDRTNLKPWKAELFTKTAYSDIFGSIDDVARLFINPGIREPTRLVTSCFAIFTFEPLTLSLTSMPSCNLESLTNILILCLILKASDQSLRKSLSLNLNLS
ncbi:hypothetical protein Tco_0506449 [Tanacetum coccineum]